MHNSQCTIHNEGIACGDDMPIRTPQNDKTKHNCSLYTLCRAAETAKANVPFAPAPKAHSLIVHLALFSGFPSFGKSAYEHYKVIYKDYQQ